MSLYVIGDLHLSLGSNKPMDIFGPKWENYTDKIANEFSQLIPEDTIVLCGDTSWAMSLEEAKSDFAFIDSLPGRKIILKGNHDYWWTTASKMDKYIKAEGFNTLSFLHNNSFSYDGISICGSRGWFFEEETDNEHDIKMINREVLRLKKSLSEAENEEKIVFLHYPPVYRDYVCKEIINVLTEYSVKKCYYGHIHGYGHKNAYTGNYMGIEFRMISADFIGFKPEKIQ